MENKYVLLNSEGVAIGEAPTMQACKNYRSHLMLEALIDGETFELFNKRL